MAAPGDLDFDAETGPNEYPDDDDISSLKSNIKRKFFQARRTPTGGSKISKTSKRSVIATPLRGIRRKLTNGSLTTPVEERKRPSDGRELIEFLAQGQSKSDAFLDACDCYVEFVDSKYRAHWPAIQPVIAGAKQSGPGPDEEDTAKVDKVMTFIAKDLSEKKDFALVDLEDDLINEGLIIDNANDERAGLHQLMFTFLGWLTMLYDPRLDCKPKKLQVNKSTINTEGNKVTMQSRAFDTHSQDLEYVDQSLYNLLGRFGKLIPDLPLRQRSEIAPPSQWIVVPFVCYQTLSEVCDVKIEWVDALGMHLEFDSNRKTVKIFRFPSFCRLMYRHKQRGLLSQLLDDRERDLRGEPQGEFITNDYFREMLLTYRLIFGQDAKSSSLFAKELRSLNSSKGGKSAWGSKGRVNQPHVFALADADPLLALLCTQRADAPGACETYMEIGAAAAQSYYTPLSFPFFAEKLLVLQAYVKEQHPHDWKTLWHDHRNESNWWQFWAVLFIGGGTLILGSISLAFQIWQAVLTQQQLVLSMNSPAPSPPPGDI